MRHGGQEATPCLFLDIGGVLLTNGWDHHALQRAADHFQLEIGTLTGLHDQAFSAYEEGRMDLDGYLDRVVFLDKRDFTRAAFRKFMFDQSAPDRGMLELMCLLKAKYHLKIVVVSNEGRELNDYRIRQFKLDAFVDTFVSSCYVHLRKPDPELFRLAMDLAHVEPSHIVYVENTPMFVKVAQDLGIRSILHTDCESTSAQLALLGLGACERVSLEVGS